VLRLISDLLTYKAKTHGTQLASALEAASRLMKHRGIVFIISDFLAKDFEIPLKRLAYSNDVVAVQVRDEREYEIPDIGQILLTDPETGEERYVDTSSYFFKQWHKDHQAQFEEELQSLFKGSQVESLKVLTQEDYGEAVVRFFRARARRKK